MRLAETVGRWLGHVELVLGGAEVQLHEGEDALAAGDAARARLAAHEILARVPGSPLGLALLADACELGGLDAEYAMALEELAKQVPSRGDVWVRLGKARAATSAPAEDVRDAYVRGLAVAEPGSDARREALIALADLALAEGESGRAELWLDRLAGDRGADVALRRAEVQLARGDAARALEALAHLELATTDGRGHLALGRARALERDPAAFAPLLRATILDTRGASEALSSAVGWVPVDDVILARVRSVVEGRGEGGLARWRAAFARAEGRREEARTALVEALRGGQQEAARPLLEAAIEDREPASLRLAVEALAQSDAPSDPLLADARRLIRALGEEPARDEGRAEPLLEALTELSTPRAVAWGSALRESLARGWVPPRSPARWELLLARLEHVARALHDLDASARIATLAEERRRPLRLAIVGEFNAGKSTFINALVGQEIAPTGVLPTTATLHHLRYAPDPIARIFFQPGHDPRERIVPVTELRAVLKTVDTGDVQRVEIHLPIASLTRVEILDTPGFNAPDVRHTEAARRAFDEADAALWLLDAGQPMKRSEREVLEEARAARLPVQVLVNKIDRLSAAADRERVEEAVRSGLTETGLSSWSTPLLLSARRALAGKLGDAAALADSGWSDVEAMLEREFVGRSEELKERALRRRALGIVATLGRGAAREADGERARDEAARARHDAMARVAAKVERESETVAARIAEGLGRQASVWRREIALVVAGRDKQSLENDPSLQRYRVDRALSHLARPLAHALAGAADGTGIAPADLTPLARASIRTFAGLATPDTPLTPLARSAIASLVEYLISAAATPPTPLRATGLVGELGAFAAVLG